MKLALTCVPTYGHMYPMSHFAKALVERGHEVFVITSNSNETKIEKIFEDVPKNKLQLIFTNGPSQDLLTVSKKTNDRNETGDE